MKNVERIYEKLKATHDKEMRKNRMNEKRLQVFEGFEQKQSDRYQKDLNEYKRKYYETQELLDQTERDLHEHEKELEHEHYY